MTRKSCNDKTFVKITNEQIYEKLCSLEQHVISTNGKVKFNTKMIAVLGGGLVGIAGWLLQHVLGK